VSCCRRFNLIYKRISFETVWVPFADIESVSKEHGFPPTSTAPDGSAFYTLPAIRDQETGKALSDSFEIAKYLDERYLARPVIPSGTEDQQAAFVGELMSVIGLVSRASVSGAAPAPDVSVQDAAVDGVRTIYCSLGEPSKSVYAARIRGYGLDLATQEKRAAAEQRALVSAALDRLAEALDAQGGTNGHFVGDSVTFADLAAAAYVEWFMALSDEPEYILALNGGRWKRLLGEIKA
jgi:glutathione S-transferase